MPPALMLRISALAALTSLVPLAAFTPAPAPNLAPRDLLRSIGQFTDADWAAVERGESVSRLLESSPREIAVAGAVRIYRFGRRPGRALPRHRRLQKSSLVLDAQRMSVPPVRADLDRMPLDQVQPRPPLMPARRLPGQAGGRRRAQVPARYQLVLDALAAGFVEPVARRAAVVRPRLRRERKARAAGLRQQGAAGQRSRRARHPGCAEYGFLAGDAPEFHAYLQEFGPRIPEGAEQTLYWTKEDIGVRPIVRISHQVTRRAPGSNPAAIIVTNQVTPITISTRRSA